MARRPPTPMCQCGHPYGVCPARSRCTHRDDPEDPETRCLCPGFRVPNSGGAGARHRAPKSKKKGTPWWR